MQHWIWQYQLGYNRHPDIKFPAEQFLRIADVACGNGYAATADARHHPTLRSD